MRKTLLIIGIILLVCGVLSLLVAWLWWFAARNTMDAPGDFYAKRYQLAGKHLIWGGALIAAGIIALIVRVKAA